MKLKHLTTVLLSAGLMFMISCKGKPKDADIQATVTTALQSTPGISADVKDGVVTLAGTVTNQADKDAAENAAKVTQGVKSVVNNITVAAPPPPPPPAPDAAATADAALKTGVDAIVKDFPGITADVKDGVITITGESKADRWKKLKIALDALKPKKVDASGLKVK
ncbi:BON domain-containing protein [Chitinophaga sp. 22321]|uniref:BON domain-containing protein n=1 Tax=Chitinophaga hostae TaxID=2831022 RepID=A0ABS5J9K0_9BACT|nr:BON domain-containing protein [Chitinophaga hostae]MBS0031874.1 BON domain-containing protein [Chitinophaga hostae]